MTLRDGTRGVELQAAKVPDHPKHVGLRCTGQVLSDDRETTRRTQGDGKHGGDLIPVWFPPPRG
jgi:hypothetical protein